MKKSILNIATVGLLLAMTVGCNTQAEKMHLEFEKAEARYLGLETGRPCLWTGEWPAEPKGSKGEKRLEK